MSNNRTTLQAKYDNEAFNLPIPAQINAVAVLDFDDTINHADSQNVRKLVQPELLKPIFEILHENGVLLVPGSQRITYLKAASVESQGQEELRKRFNEIFDLLDTHCGKDRSYLCKEWAAFIGNQLYDEANTTNKRQALLKPGPGKDQGNGKTPILDKIKDFLQQKGRIVNKDKFYLIDDNPNYNTTADFSNNGADHDKYRFIDASRTNASRINNNVDQSEPQQQLAHMLELMVKTIPADKLVASLAKHMDDPHARKLMGMLQEGENLLTNYAHQANNAGQITKNQCDSLVTLLTTALTAKNANPVQITQEEYNSLVGLLTTALDQKKQGNLPAEQYDDIINKTSAYLTARVNFSGDIDTKNYGACSNALNALSESCDRTANQKLWGAMLIVGGIALITVGIIFALHSCGLTLGIAALGGAMLKAAITGSALGAAGGLFASTSGVGLFAKKHFDPLNTIANGASNVRNNFFTAVSKDTRKATARLEYLLGPQL